MKVASYFVQTVFIYKLQIIRIFKKEIPISRVERL